MIKYLIEHTSRGFPNGLYVGVEDIRVGVDEAIKFDTEKEAIQFLDKNFDQPSKYAITEHDFMYEEKK
jgi:hypothetical protein